MNVTLTRKSSGRDGTIGELAIDGLRRFVSLEPDEDRPNHPAIPVGTYQVVVTPSLRFKRMLPLIIGVKGRTGIRIHPGNYASAYPGHPEGDTEGCILLGMDVDGHLLQNSRMACELFQSAIAPCLAKDEAVTLQIVEGTI